MELIGREGGSGIYIANNREKEQFIELKNRIQEEQKARQECTPTQYKTFHHNLVRAVQQIFPFIEEPGYRESAVCKMTYETITRCDDLGFGFHVNSKLKDGEIEITPIAEGYKLTLNLNGGVCSSPHYLTCVDDVVSMLGKAHEPMITGAKPLPKGRYGIAEVMQLPTVVQLYEIAEELVKSKNPEGNLGYVPNNNSLAVLRHDALGHQNPAVRELSRKMYHEELAKMLLYCW